MPGSLLQLKDLHPVRQTEDAQITARTGNHRRFEDVIVYSFQNHNYLSLGESRESLHRPVFLRISS
ncbi:MAG: hypothetical protein CMM02_00950 [Rhodopirellula sp.]|nr:hypothetical protein [Rhodopirellula sp.]